MKPLIWLTLLLGQAVAAGTECAYTSREYYVSDWDEAPAVEHIHQRIDPDGTVQCAFYPDRQNRLNVLVRYEEGHLNGVDYKLYYPDGSAVIQGNAEAGFSPDDRQNTWTLVCRPNGQSTPVCTLQRRDLRLQKDSQGHQLLRIGEQHREDSEWLVRVDGQWAVRAPADSGFSAAQTRQLVAQMSRGKAADTRYFDASLRGPTERTIDLFGFSQALEIMDRVLAQLETRPADDGS